ncbi:DUF4974 domain-containing protein [Sphingobacterium sp. UT-1RO-CII-1]|uniref:FecR family protein n=1 Tax=Sphingobacterium sp. UT-1RO-CII-1 TaxID=2995225 RepID=UPI00227A11F4|nr:FecR domain-containing protein [Sphingobacterium sp. UT-1RO-CII-1]MCY4780009.1 DUF4974 domain-containing protein [Sphingobacterium sp. UT-1RO-CII-1]
MKNHYDKEVLLKIAYKLEQGVASAEERAYFDRWYQSFDDDKIELPYIYDHNLESIHDRMHDKIFLKIDSEDKKSSTRFFNIRWISAAAILLLASVSLLVFLNKSVDTAAFETAVQHEDALIKPAHAGGTLTLANGNKINLSEVGIGEIALDGGLVITKLANGEIIYEQTNNSSAPNINNTISTVNGETYRVRLPDGTSVWVNTGSSLTFPLAFATNERKVHLTGEAYFEVAPDTKAPFKVLTDYQTIEVLGTHFNVSAYTDEAVVETTLLEGKVKVAHAGENALLHVGQQARSVKDRPGIRVRNADLEAVMSWKNGYFRFRNDNIKTVMQQIARWYDVDVVFTGRVTDEKFNGTIERTKSIHEVLGMLEATKVLRFKIEGRRLTVME